MHIDDFNDFIRALRNSYGLTTYRARRGEDQAEVVEWLYEQCGKIPETAVDWLIDRIHQDSPNKFPPLPHRAILSAWQQYLFAHPEKREFKEPERKCRYTACENGLLFLWGDDNCRYVFRCECGRSNLTGIPLLDDELRRSQRWTADSPEQMERMQEIHGQTFGEKLWGKLRGFERLKEMASLGDEIKKIQQGMLQ